MLTQGTQVLGVLANDFDIESLCDGARDNSIGFLRSVMADYTLWAGCQRDYEDGKELKLPLAEQIRMGRIISNDTNIYFIDDSQRGLIKIGMSRDIGRRMRSLRKEFGAHLRLIASFSGPGDMETYLHRRLSEWRVKGEWFTPCEQLLGFAEACADGGLKGVIMHAIKLEAEHLTRAA